MANEKRTIRYSEPADYFPKNIRKKYKLGEYAETEDNKPTKKTVVKKSNKK